MRKVVLKPSNVIVFFISVVFLGGPLAFLFYRHINKKKAVEGLNTASPNVNFKPTHFVSVIFGKGAVTVRSKAFTVEAYRIANKRTPEADELNKQTIVAYVKNGSQVELIDKVGVSFKIRYYTDKGILEGYIASSYRGSSTLTPLNDYNK
jgi:hypothetical protein